MDADKQLRIAVVAYLGVADGISNLMINIQSHLDRNKINYDYLVFRDQDEAREKEVISLGSNKIAASVDHIKIRLFRSIARIFQIKKVCKKNNIKILHYNADNPADMIKIIGAKLGGVKQIIIHSHNAGSEELGFGIRLASVFFKPLIPKLCDRYLACSELAAQFMFPKSILKKNKYEIIKNGIDLNKFDYNPSTREKVRKQLNLNGKFVVGHVGRFSAQKNHAFLLEIFKKIYELDNTAFLLLFGDGELMDAIKEKAKALGIQSAIIFYGASNEMYKMYQAIDVFVMPSLHEGLPVTGIEAQASGLPCVFSDAVTKEVNVIGTSEFISLDSSVDVWAERILSHKGQSRESKLDLLKNAGYDIQQTADLLTEIYFDMSKNL